MSSLINKWYSNGKLLITGEYLVMYGAKALAIPLNKGQSFEISPIKCREIVWTAYTPNGIWFRAIIELNEFKVIQTNNINIANNLVEVLKALNLMSGVFKHNGFNIVTKLDFNPEFGFGTSSTLISNLASWADVDPYELLDKTFGGSGYDIACARNKYPIKYQLKGNNRVIENVDFNPSFSDNLYFVYLGKKQNSADSIKHFNKKMNFGDADIEDISQITHKIINCEKQNEFDDLLTDHEEVMSRILEIPKIETKCFEGLPFKVKSLGAWGGDFVLLSSNDSSAETLKAIYGAGYTEVFRYDDLIINSM
ncbi:MAG: GYDIA family GHMP kinase [Bacteroidales bacterium]|nr:GYDIA family GHMP kinase [Bacteroidales bacterium]MDG1901406.1 GYDIA family GHMP kinase [Bacteroidales bacterium]MDG2080942.1 GYDIA family GHMP kinase [Bacteroidales bacterium]